MVSWSNPGALAAVRCRPPWAASIRHADLGPDESRITYTFHFRARPRWLAWLLEPIMLVVFRWETRKRLRALRDHFRKITLLSRP